MPLQIYVPASETYGDVDPETGKQMFTQTKGVTLTLEHSLISISKWEAKWHKPFISSDKTEEETLDYIKCMTTTQNVDPNTFKVLTSENIRAITEYINDPHTATTVRENPNAPKSREIITSELIYYWMISYNIPVDICQKWHLNRLLMLIRVFNIKNAPPKKMNRSEMLSQRAALNRARRARYNTNG